jgi:hypothetical protein
MRQTGHTGGPDGQEPKMRFALNLRSDLTRLNDAEVADRLVATWRAYEVAEQDARFAWRELKYSTRGPIRHPWAYLFSSIMAIGDRGGLGFWMGQPFFPSLLGDRRSRALVKMHLNLCEIRDIQDEIECRNVVRTARN